MSLSIAFRHRFAQQRFDIALEALAAGTLVLLGESGAGKSTVAAVLAGMLRPDWGRVAIGGTVLMDTAAGVFVPPERRRVGMVFQQARLFPHLSVRGNLHYGMRRAGSGPIGEAEMVGLLGLEGLLDRRPATLSGGEAQRVAIGRALLAQPRLLILDEPLANLDHARRREILPFIAGLRARLALPILYITHALEEALVLADTLALIGQGQVAACGPLAHMLGRADLPLAAREDAGAVLECRIAAQEPQRGLTRLAIGGGAGQVLLVPAISGAVGTALRVRVGANDVILATEAPRAISVQNRLAARVERVVQTPPSCLVELRLGEAPLLARITLEAARDLELAPGREVLALVKSVAVTRI